MNTPEQISACILHCSRPEHVAGCINACLRYRITDLWLQKPVFAADAELQDWKSIELLIEDLSETQSVSVRLIDEQADRHPGNSDIDTITSFFDAACPDIGLIMPANVQLIRDPRPLINKFTHLKNSRVIAGSLYIEGEVARCVIKTYLETSAFYLAKSNWNSLIKTSEDCIDQMREELSALPQVEHQDKRPLHRSGRLAKAAGPVVQQINQLLNAGQWSVLYPPSRLCVVHEKVASHSSSGSMQAKSLTIRPLYQTSLIAEPLNEQHNNSNNFKNSMKNLAFMIVGRCRQLVPNRSADNQRLAQCVTWLRNMRAKVRSELDAQQSFIQHYRNLQQLEGEGIKVNVGAGPSTIPGYVAVDANAIYGHSVVQMSPYLALPKARISEIYLAHVLEHFPHWQTEGILANYYRLLKPNCTLRISVPDFRWISDKYNQGADLEDYLQALYGGQDYDFNTHLTIFDERYLRRLLWKVGFRKIQHWDASEFFAQHGCPPDSSIYPLSLNLLAIK
jgi:hypothetical protein